MDRRGCLTHAFELTLRTRVELLSGIYYASKRPHRGTAVEYPRNNGVRCSFSSESATCAGVVRGNQHLRMTAPALSHSPGLVPRR